MEEFDASKSKPVPKHHTRSARQILQYIKVPAEPHEINSTYIQGYYGKGLTLESWIWSTC